MLNYKKYNKIISGIWLVLILLLYVINPLPANVENMVSSE